ncbi:hypothetical protein HMPREF9997_02198 [Corynebacterium durum F0235]|uniref:Uncharacterized protein n=1 Tax=Corynebacterium durum F0235 TaxID=1035195 RepID=L1MC50_9CORY|nr:hypothetical protein HMPREF9997_02198 [Corynebacterium durum F0235]
MKASKSLNKAFRTCCGPARLLLIDARSLSAIHSRAAVFMRT